MKPADLYFPVLLFFALDQAKKVQLINSFHLNGHTLGFHPQTQKLGPPCTA